MAVQPKDLGLVSAYGAALEGGYTGTYDEYKTKMLELLNLNLSSLGSGYDDTALQSSITTIRAAIDALDAKVDAVPEYEVVTAAEAEVWFAQGD